MDKVTATRWPIVWAAMGAGIVAAAHIGKLPPALPMIRADLGVDLVTAGWIASIFSATGFVLGLAAGSISDRVGPRRVVLFGILALAAGSLAGSFAPNGAVLLATRFIEGIGFAAATIAAPAIVARATSPADSKLVVGGVWAAYFPIGFTCFLLISPIVLETAGWRVLWQIAAAVTVLWFFVFRRMTAGLAPARAPGGRSVSLFRNMALTVARPGALLAAACFALYAAQHVSFVVWLPTMVIDSWGASVFVAAAVPAAVLTVNAGGNYLSGWLMKGGAPIWLLLTIGGAGMGLTEFGIFSGAVPDWARLVLALLFGLFGGLVPASCLAAGPVYAPSPAQIGTINGLLVMGTNAGQLFGPPALAAVKQSSGSWQDVSWPMLGMAVALVALALVSRRFERRAEAAA